MTSSMTDLDLAPPSHGHAPRAHTPAPDSGPQARRSPSPSTAPANSNSLPSREARSVPVSASSAPRGRAARLSLVAAAAIAALLLAGCAPTLVAPERPVATPTEWEETLTLGGAITSLDSDWWQGFGSAELPGWIDTALVASPDLGIAAERLVQAELALRNAGASLLPTLDLNAATSVRASDASGVSASTVEASSIGLAVAYEIDLWNSRLSSLRGSEAQFAASRHDFAAARLSLTASVANTYTQVLAQRARLAIAEDNLAIAERLFEIVQARFRHGAASALDVSRQRSTVLAQRDALLPLQAQERQSRRALALLIGQTPQGFDIGDERFDMLAIPTLAPLLPAELLTRRPDLAATEARLLASEANIAVARAALFPARLAIGATAGLSGTEFGLLGLGSPAGSATLALSLVQAIFDGGRLRNQVALTESQQRQLLEEYRRAILTALKETEDAIAAVERNRLQENTQRELVREAERALRLSELRYREGSDSLGTLLDTQRSLFSAQDQLIQIRLARLTASLDLYKALGGGWQDPGQDDQAFQESW